MAERSAFSALKRKLLFGPLLILLVVWALLYLPHLRTNPGWYGDEALALTAGIDLTHGIAAHRAIWNTFWHPYAPYQPGYEILIGTAARLVGGDIYGGRAVNALLGLGVALVMAFYGRALIGVFPALFAALMFLCYEQSIIHFRWIFTHNLIALGFIITFLALARPARLRNDLVAGAGLALGAAALPLFIYGLLPAGLVRLKRPASWPWIFGPPILVVIFSLFLGWFLHRPHNFLLGDLAETLRFYWQASEENSSSLGGALGNFWRFFTQDAWHMAGFIMLGFCVCKRFYAIGLSGLLIAILLVQNRQNLTVFYYQAIIFLPLMMMAYGVAARRGIQGMRKQGIKSGLLQKLQTGLLAIPLASALVLLPQSLTGALRPRIAYWTTQSSQEVEEAARWLNEHAKPEDLVICPVTISWLLKTRTTDFQQATSWAGLPTWPFKNPLPKAQFRYAANLAEARFVIVGDIDRRWTFTQPNVDKLVEKISREEWPVAWSSPNYLILENPKLVPAKTRD